MSNEYEDFYADPEWHEGFEYDGKMAKEFKEQALEYLRCNLDELRVQMIRDENEYWDVPWEKDEYGNIENNEAILERGYIYRQRIVEKIRNLIAEIEDMPLE